MADTYPQLNAELQQLRLRVIFPCLESKVYHSANPVSQKGTKVVPKVSVQLRWCEKRTRSLLCSTRKMLADLMTKALPEETHLRLTREVLGLQHASGGV